MAKPESRLGQTRCAIYTRKSSEEGLDQAFNSLDAQREACEAYVISQQLEGWKALATQYNDGGFSGGNTKRPGLIHLLEDIRNGKIDTVVVYKVDRLSRSLADFARLVELFDKTNVSFVSVTQQFNTSNSMGRLTLNVLLSFAQFEREVTGERIRDKIAASKKKGMWMGGTVPLGYETRDRLLIANPTEVPTVRQIYSRYLALGCVRTLKMELDEQNIRGKPRKNASGNLATHVFSRGALYTLLRNPIYIGKIKHRDKVFDGQHKGIVDFSTWKKVQKTLENNRQKKLQKTMAKDPSLLAGLVYDDRDNRMSPTHTRKGDRRYRYYVSQATLQFRKNEAGSVIRLPAHTLETLVIRELVTLLTDRIRLIKIVANQNLSASEQKQYLLKAAVLAKSWDKQTLSEKIRTLGDLITKITISRNQIEIGVSRRDLFHTFLNREPNKDDKSLDEVFSIITKVKLKRSGVEPKLIIGSTTLPAANNTSARAIQTALRNALRWNHQLTSPSPPSITALAKKENVTQRHIGQMLKFAFLAPDIMDAINRGELPVSLTLNRLKKGFSMQWAEQKSTLGFD